MKIIHPEHPVHLCKEPTMLIRERNIPSEKAFSDLWERALELRPSVVGRDGVEYEVIFPGVRNQAAGPDFLGATLRRDGQTIGGDVELHLDPSGWRAHGHHTDPNYRGVVLQVVLKAGRSGVSHSAPPTAVARFDPASDEPADAVDAQDNRPTPDLRALGLARFRSKSAGFKMEMESATNPNQPLYAALLDAMGYARNRKPFRALAALLPIERLTPLANEPRAAAEFAILSALATRGGLLNDVDERERVQMRPRRPASWTGTQPVRVRVEPFPRPPRRRADCADSGNRAANPRAVSNKACCAVSRRRSRRHMKLAAFAV